MHDLFICVSKFVFAMENGDNIYEELFLQSSLKKKKIN